MEELRNINIAVLEKYRNPAAYEKVMPGIYKNLQNGKYCFCFSADCIDQYPLEDLLAQYSLNCTNDYCGEEVQIDGQTIWLAELETDGDFPHLIKLLNCATMIGKEIVDFSLNGHAILCVDYGTTDCIVNNKVVRVPILGCRHDPWGAMTFNIRYPEMQLKARFINMKYDIPAVLPESIAYKALLLKNYFAYLVYTENGEYHALVFNQQRVLRNEKGNALISSIRGYQ